MKKKFSGLIALMLYFIGEFVAFPMEVFKMNFLWKPYTYIMKASYKVQIWGGAKEPWENV